MAHHIIYVPGIGDHHSYGQDIFIQSWRLFGLYPHYFPLGWNRKTGYEAKQQRLLALVDNLFSQGHKVSLVGVSAGASAVLNTYAEYSSVNATILISGKVNHPETVGQRTFDLNPDFKESLRRLQKTLLVLESSKEKRILSIHPWFDMTVPIPDTKIKGAAEKTVPGWGHKSGIFFGIMLGGPSISQFVRIKPKI